MPDPNATEELRELIREAHGLLKDLRAERRAIEQLVDGIPAKVNNQIRDVVAKGLKDLGEQTKRAMDASVAKVAREFDRLEAVLTGTDPAARRKGKRPLEDVIREHPDAKGTHRD